MNWYGKQPIRKGLPENHICGEVMFDNDVAGAVSFTESTSLALLELEKQIFNNGLKA